MELALNLEWIALAITMCWLWVRHARRDGQGRKAQLVSLALVLFTMFAVITMYDDMAMAQNPAETRSFQREDDLGVQAHAPLHPVVASNPMLAPEPQTSMDCSGVSGSLFIPTTKAPVLTSIRNRPPPAV